MYYLTKFCRICIQTGVKLLDIETLDTDSIKLSDKLEFCTQMVISRESLSTEICLQCIKKLRITYDFHNKCKQSTEVLKGYLTELISASEKLISPNEFVNSELRVTLTPICNKNLNFYKRKRITKEERCTLLKKLLLSGKVKENHPQYGTTTAETPKGGLRDIIDFTKNYNFDCDLDVNQNHEQTPLDKLVQFSDTFFMQDFSEFRDTILYIIDNKDNLCESDEDEEMFDDGESPIKCEEVIVEPDIKIKCENDMDEYESSTIEEDLDQNGNEDFALDDEQPSTMEILDRFVGKFNKRRNFSQFSVRCRTRGNPYINPHLKRQFQMRSFKCDKCGRYFKGPGYLNAHISKIHH